MEEDLENQILKVVSDWSFELKGLVICEEIIAIYYGAQDVFDGYELYLSGHTWFDGHDLWLFDKNWNPSTNYVSLGPNSLKFDKLYILDILENVIQREIIKSQSIYEKLIVTVGLVNGEYKRIK